jgi:arginyl-tRNA synthetase
MNIIEQLQKDFSNHIGTLFNLSDTYSLTLNTDEAKQQFGDLSSNAAMILAKQLGKAPRVVAQEIVTSFAHPLIKEITIAGPGFLNFYLTHAALEKLAQELFEHPRGFFMPSEHAHRPAVSIEFVSANPTGPLHFGHGRGGIIGDVLGNVLHFLGYKATKEFYINDAGAQIQKLGTSLFIRCQQALGIEAALPEDAYHGEYLQEVARDMIAEHGEHILNHPMSFFEEYGKTIMLARIKNTLENYGISYDVWFSEKTLHDSGAIQEALDILEQNGHLYEQEGALWFRSTTFGDDKDRVVRKADGTYTYVAADIAYMRNKIARGYSKLLMTLGHDHHSYVIRLEALLKALGLDKENSLEVILYQLVKIKESGQAVRMSKRAGNIITLDDVIAEVGSDVARFFYLNRKADAQLEFDIDLAAEKTENNPVYYIQYAFVRTKSILEKALEAGFAQPGIQDATPLGADEALIIKKIASLKTILQDIANQYQTHILAYYTLELAQLFSRYYGKNRIIDLENKAQTEARLMLVVLVRNTLELCLELMGLSKPERM